LMQPSWADRKAIASALNRIVHAVTVSPFYVFATNAECFGMAGSFSMKHF
jgi:L-asparaginase II